MRVLVVTNLYPNPFQPQRGTFNRDQIRALSRGHDVRVISPIAWTDEWAARRAGHPPLPPGRRGTRDGVPVEYPRVYFLPRVLRWFYGWAFRQSISPSFRRAVRDFRPDVVYATWAYPDGWAAVRLGHGFGLPVVLKVHGSDVLELGKHPGRRAGTVEALRRADAVVAVSRDLARHVVELGAEPGDVHVVYNGIDGQLFCPGDRAEARRRLGLDPHRPVLLFVGNLVPVKGPDILIEACAALARGGQEFDLHVIGKGPLRPHLERRAGDLGLGDRVRFHGVVPHARLPDWFRSASALVVPSRSEGVPNVLLEATACGTPFVASRVGGVPEVADRGAGHLVEPGRPDQLAVAVREVLAAYPTGPAASLNDRTHRTACNELLAVLRLAADRGTRVK